MPRFNYYTSTRVPAPSGPSVLTVAAGGCLAVLIYLVIVAAIVGVIALVVKTVFGL